MSVTKINTWLRQSRWHYFLFFESAVMCTVTVCMFLFPPSERLHTWILFAVVFGLLAYLLAANAWRAIEWQERRAERLKRYAEDPEWITYLRLKEKFKEDR